VLKLGYKASAEQFGPTELLEFSRLAEQSGFDSVFISDHFQPWKHHGGHAPFSLAWLGALGALTSRITIGTSVMTPTFRYHPAVVAQAFATHDLSAERAASRWIVSTDPDEHVERIGYYVDLGFDHLVFHAPGPDQERFIRLYAEHVLPRLRRRFGALDEARKSA
jgi:alkanesulfonate monooxygenase SsuD/methylene tetrahydromethanopterin reductase-like flavin-dependent oxidoreductase (luciferase family)